MLTRLFLLLGLFFLAGCAGTVSQRVSESCSAPISVPVLHAGDTWRWRFETGNHFSRQYLRQTEDGLFEADPLVNGLRYYYDSAHTVRRVLVPRTGRSITDPTVDIPQIGYVTLDFPLHVGKTWSWVVRARDKNLNQVYTYMNKFTVLGCERVTVPAGTFVAAVIEEEVRSSDDSWGVRTWWYAPDVKHHVAVVHGRASDHDFWRQFPDWALTSYQIVPSPKGAASSAPPATAPVTPSASSTPSPAPPAPVVAATPPTSFNIEQGGYDVPQHRRR